MTRVEKVVNTNYDDTCVQHSFSEMKINEVDMNINHHELKSTSSYSTHSQIKHKKDSISKDTILEYKFKYPTTFAELKLDGFTDSDAVRYIRNNIEIDNYWIGYSGKIDDYIPGSSMTFMKTLGYS